MHTVSIEDNLDTELCKNIMDFHSSNQFARLLGIELIRLGNGYSGFIFQAEKDHTNPYGIIHGGVTATLGDIAMACALRTRGIQVITAELTVNYVSPGNTGVELEITGQALHLGKTVCLAEFSVHDNEKNHLIASGRGIFISRGKFIQTI
ncbi:thioesterase superfamily protein [Desulfofarcimen acetoxidans DSM 771]|jgi:acyl-CoA thioesterase|uniref:Thioesterase superfamily protein n=1 Tax=Desulfofarcimen acetoxidans (strain ATCC 49208 / DSM 771 / KCTC 5769 / VKM B-1644 / 5575) TaxID=485916 RepID=C8VVU9_DESAS|nr:PaaI family thioesterase [Desulfofarcimen acetoxidans]ACV64236.1 thioesterase superfamily protein [Desulfofarcimen acetoxidans DSM 771]